ncbi:1,2-phenylacetyl-CoA epoxidase subunit PaaC [Hymenobacter sp. BT770]|uniref:1,2-phenylacetyl-CoA epoxidase subunit PaaC n=1 Tax=Hymenobacter sp. BT770 TaxID=2886942 RepID=UPI001D100C5E|nr:1,2-phenylacetyl-CoA epoxidase subunit PaaC [Hymenobacter sp. BT770]MCC3153106.1 phenylacetate-CoA oxygenase subunit PaaC [Hymenobacter sp. BT770]MDO3415420.1 1,2-phenylacetyl-CoA epoxidase subunit PaaC [Hymenobacter sp. BT770]
MPLTSQDPRIDLMYRLADDQLILGHRNSEWNGLGPILEEDIAFSSMAQDKLGHSLQMYSMLHALGEAEPDTVAFTRNAPQFHCCQLVELPIGEYDFSLTRHFLFDHAELLRFEALASSSYEPLAQVARKLRGELKYHALHANTWMKRLGTATEEAIERMQHSLNFTLPYALGIFEKTDAEPEIISSGLFVGEDELKSRWLESITKVLAQTALEMPEVTTLTPVFGGRHGQHTEFLQPLLDEMAEVFRLDPTADW